MFTIRSSKPLHHVALVLALLIGACGDDATGPDASPPPETIEVGVVLNSVDVSLTIFSNESPDDASTVGLGADGSPVGFSHRGNVVAVPMGTVPAVTVVDVRARRVVRTIGLPEGSGATGSAFVNDSVAIVANPGLNSVSPVNVLRGTTGEPVQVGTYPTAVAVTDGRIFVANAELVNFSPAGPGTLTVLDAGSREVLGTVALSGLNPSALTVGPDGRVWALHSGEFGGGDGSVSIVDPESLEETAHHPGFGEFPGALAFGPDGLLHVSSFSYGMAIWDPGTGRFVRSPADAVTPDGVTAVPGVAFDGRDRLHVVVPVLPGQENACLQPGAVYRLDSEYRIVGEIPVGTCPIDLAFLQSAP